MSTNNILRASWDDFIFLERRLANLTDCIHFSERNMKVFSLEISNIFLTACSSFEGVIKKIAELQQAAIEPNNILGFLQFLSSNFPKSFAMHADIARYDLRFEPFKDYSPSESPGSPAWWRSHNELKHLRLQNINSGSLENCINALAALFIANLCLSKSLGQDGLQFDLVSSPKLLSLTGSRSGFQPAAILGSVQCPD